MKKILGKAAVIVDCEDYAEKAESNLNRHLGFNLNGKLILSDQKECVCKTIKVDFAVVLFTILSSQ